MDYTGRGKLSYALSQQALDLPQVLGAVVRAASPPAAGKTPTGWIASDVHHAHEQPQRKAARTVELLRDCGSRIPQKTNSGDDVGCKPVPPRGIRWFSLDLPALSSDNSERTEPMSFSTKGRYALCAMVDLAEHRTQGYVPLKSIASRQDISEKYLESILKLLVAGKFVVGMRGKGGGYRLTKDPADYSVASILRLTEGDLSCVPGINETHSTVSQIPQYRVLDMWRGLDRIVTDYLESVSVADLVAIGDPGDNYVI